MESLLLQRDNCTLLLVQLQWRLTVLENTRECFEEGAFWFWPSKTFFLGCSYLTLRQPKPTLVIRSKGSFCLYLELFCSPHLLIVFGPSGKVSI